MTMLDSNRDCYGQSFPFIFFSNGLFTLVLRKQSDIQIFLFQLHMELVLKIYQARNNSKT